MIHPYWRGAREISKKQLRLYRWWPRSGTILDKATGKHIITDRIMAFIASAPSSKSVTKNRAYEKLLLDRTDGFVYFAIGEKKYKVRVV